jgi:hypothetical protein
VLAGVSGTPTREMMIGELYNRTRGEFWKNVRGDSSASKFFTDHGFVFQGGERSAPLISAVSDFPGKEREFLLSLDHMAPKATGDNWQRALDADNLQFVSFWDNWLLNQIERKLPELTR